MDHLLNSWFKAEILGDLNGVDVELLIPKQMMLSMEMLKYI